MQCGSQTCVCPAIPSATIGRLAKELRIGEDEQPFIMDIQLFHEAGRVAARTALEEFGGYRGITSGLPFDRGDANHALIYLCLSIAEATEDTNPDLAATLRAEAVRVGASPKELGSASARIDLDELLDRLRAQWRDLDQSKQKNIKSAGGLVEGLGEILDSIKVLFITPNPSTTSGPLDLAEEQRAVRIAIKSGRMGAKIFIEDLHAARANDFRSALLSSTFDVIHFSGHADNTNLVFENENKEPDFVGIDAIAQLVLSHPSVKCVVLNACEAVQNLSVPISPITIGMDQTIEDGAAIEFSRGFYDALGNGLSFERAFEEGKNAVKLKGFDDNLIKMIKL